MRDLSLGFAFVFIAVFGLLGQAKAACYDSGVHDCNWYDDVRPVLSACAGCHNGDGFAFVVNGSKSTVPLDFSTIAGAQAAWSLALGAAYADSRMPVKVAWFAQDNPRERREVFDGTVLSTAGFAFTDGDGTAWVRNADRWFTDHEARIIASWATDGAAFPTGTARWATYCQDIKPTMTMMCGGSCHQQTEGSPALGTVITNALEVDRESDWWKPSYYSLEKNKSWGAYNRLQLGTMPPLQNTVDTTSSANPKTNDIYWWDGFSEAAINTNVGQLDNTDPDQSPYRGVTHLSSTMLSYILGGYASGGTCP